MASAERAYVDPNALRSLYIHDHRSAWFCAWRMRSHGALPLTRFGRAELVNSVALAVHRKVLPPARMDRLRLSPEAPETRLGTFARVKA